MAHSKNKYKLSVVAAKSREDILAEINMLKVLVWQLWEESHGSINRREWNDLKEEIIKEMRNST